jgi:phage terminase large subunit-like protein
MLSYIIDFHAHVKKYPTHFCKKIHIACGIIEKLLKRKDIKYCESDVIAFEKMASLFYNWKGTKKKIQLDIVQKWIVACVLGIKIKSKDNPNEYLRYFTKCRIFIAKKWGKSVLMSLFAIWALLFDRDRDGAEVYFIAAKKEQAKISYDNVIVYRKQNIEISKRCKEIYADGSKYLYCPDNNGIIRYLSKSKDGLQGKNPTWVFLDEAQEIKDLSVFDAVETGQATRKQPMSISMSTAGITSNSAYHEQYSQAEAILENKDFNGNFIAIFEIDIDDSIDDKKCWIKANPALLDGRPKLEFLEKEYELVKLGEDNRSLNTFIAFHLNRCCDESQTYFTTDLIKKALVNIKLKDYYDTYAYGGVDLSSSVDFTVATVIIPYQHIQDTDIFDFYILQKYFKPKNRIDMDGAKDKVIYSNFMFTKSEDPICKELLHACNGDYMLYEDIAAWFAKLRDEFKITFRKIGYDPQYGTGKFIPCMEDCHFYTEKLEWDGTKLLSRSGEPLSAVRQGWYLSDIIKLLKFLFEKGRIKIDKENKLLAYNLYNTKVLTNKDGLCSVDKKHATGRIDGTISLLCALRVFMTDKEQFQHVLSWSDTVCNKYQ